MPVVDLHAWREEHRLSQPELADLLGVNSITVSRWERGVQSVPRYLELALCELARRLTAKEKSKASPKRK